MSKLMEGILASAPEGTVTIVNPHKNYNDALERIAKEQNKSVDELTEDDEIDALHRIGLSVLDLQVP